ncbi:hypothetical protein KY361_02675 [Candidatus Woesearchaeota archaeon]|nr:hypothetical protein [Candidatus Woesearchaeota archaeon]
MKISEESRAGWYFSGIVILAYIIVGIFKPAALTASFQFLWSIIKKIIPIFILIFVLMVLVNYFVKPKKLVKYFGKKSGVFSWPVAIITGIISTGPIYLWYPLLNELQKHGVRNGLIAVFLYNRAIKIPLLPLFILYFGFVYVIILTFVMIIASIFNGIIVEKVMEVRK